MEIPDRGALVGFLDTHHQLLSRHRSRLEQLMATAAGRRLELLELAIIIADLAGEFGQSCTDVGPEFLALDGGQVTLVFPLHVSALVTLLAGVIPEAVELVNTRPAGLVTIFIVDSGDEPALAFIPIERLLVEPCA